MMPYVGNFCIRWHEADLMACQIWEDFSENDDVRALKVDKGISLELAHICMFHFEKARLVHDEQEEIKYTKKGLWYMKNSIGKKVTTEIVCRLNQQLAVKLIQKKKSGVIGCLMGSANKKALSYIEKAHSGWRKIIRSEENNLGHQRYLSHLVYRNYLKYEMKPATKYVKNMESICVELLPKILGSPEVSNLEILEALLRVTCEMKSFPRALQICSDSKKKRDHRELIYPFGPILELVEQISVLKIFPYQLVMETHLKETQNVFEETILLLKEPKHPICSFWYDYGISIYFDFLQKSGKSNHYQQMLKFNAKIKHFSMETLASWQSMHCCSNNSSAATISEILEVHISDITFDFAFFAQERILPELCSSADLFTSDVTSAFGVPSGNFRKFASGRLDFEELIEHLIPERTEAQLLIFVQVSG